MRHCERSEAIFLAWNQSPGDCRVADAPRNDISLLLTTGIVMKKLTIFDPAMCCDTGICGVDVDAALIEFASDLDWLQKNGVEVQRFNLAQEPAAFINDPLIKTEIHESGESCLPLLVLEGKVISRGVYPDRQQLQSWTGIEPLQPVAEKLVEQEKTTSCGSASSSCCG
jgi:hypothetical protein